jgi:hypothetical protein
MSHLYDMMQYHFDALIREGQSILSFFIFT